MTSSATLANGCFWCTEAVFKRLKGIESVTSGYTGGDMDDPDYDHVSMGNTGHAESVQVVFDSAILSYADILDVFFATHDPTTLNAQGYDVGNEYRSAIFYHDEEQKSTALEKIESLNSSGVYKDKIVTQLTAFTKFYPAEKMHSNYYERYYGSQYCTVIIDPKIRKLLQKFSDKVKDEYK